MKTSKFISLAEITQIKNHSIHKFVLSVVCNMFIYVCMGFNVIISTWSVVGCNRHGIIQSENPLSRYASGQNVYLSTMSIRSNIGP